MRDELACSPAWPPASGASWSGGNGWPVPTMARAAEAASANRTQPAGGDVGETMIGELWLSGLQGGEERELQLGKGGGEGRQIKSRVAQGWTADACENSRGLTCVTVTLPLHGECVGAHTAALYQAKQRHTTPAWNQGSFDGLWPSVDATIQSASQAINSLTPQKETVFPNQRHPSRPNHPHDESLIHSTKRGA